jgi:acylphosphatase
LIELHATFKGNVQGVFFRKTVKRHAESLGLRGYARNLENGDVEAVAQGAKESLELWIQAIQNDPGIARIDSVLLTFRESKELLKGFETF